MFGRRSLQHIIETRTGGRTIGRAPVAPIAGVGGEAPPASFVSTCAEFRQAPPDVWSRYRARCTGEVPWNLPGRSAVPSVPLLAPALNLATKLVPGGEYVAGALGLTGGQQMSNGWDPWVSVGPVGMGVCPPGNRCVGGVVGGVCLGACVPSAVGPEILPGQPGIGPVYGGNGTGQVVQPGTKLCCPPGQRPNKSGYWLKNGTRIEPGTKCVAVRRTNPLNPSAASRAGRRLRSAAKASKWLQKCEIPKKRR